MSLPAFPAVEAALATRSPVHVHKLVGASKALFVAELRRRTGSLVLYITSGEESADTARMDLELFLDESVHHLPEHTTRPYDVKQAHTEVAAARLETMTHFATHGDGVIVATAKGLTEKVVGPDLLQRKHLLRFKVGDPVDLDDVTHPAHLPGLQPLPRGGGGGRLRPARGHSRHLLPGRHASHSHRDRVRRGDVDPRVRRAHPAFGAHPRRSGGHSAPRAAARPGHHRPRRARTGQGDRPRSGRRPCRLL